MISKDEKIVILLDFDGTITDKDTNTLLFSRYLKGKEKDIRKNYLNNKGTKLDYIRKIFEEIKISEDEYREFILGEFELTKGFREFKDIAYENNVELAVVSGGFTNAISLIFDKYNIKDIDIYANSLNFDNKDITIDFYDKEDQCCNYGPCGNCKIRRFNTYKKRFDKVIFIGDGHTDRWVSRVADEVFAKDALVEFLKEDGINYIEWNNFYDVIDKLF